MSGWEDIGGIDEARSRRLKEGIELPLRHPDAFHQAWASVRPRGSCSTARPAPVRPCWPRRSPSEAEANFISMKSIRPAVANGMARASSRSPSLFAARPRRSRPASCSSTRSTAWSPARGSSGGTGEPRGDRPGRQHHPRRNGRASRNWAIGGGDRRHQPADAGRSRAAAARSLRRAGLCRHPRRGGARAYPQDTHRQDAARQGCRPGQGRRRDRPLHRRGSRGRCPPRGPCRAAAARRESQQGDASDFVEALEDSRATVTAEMEEEYRRCAAS